MIDAIERLPGVDDVHHLHVWALTGEKRMATLHVVVEEQASMDLTRQRIVELLNEQFNIWHPTVQVEKIACDDRC